MRRHEGYIKSNLSFLQGISLLAFHNDWFRAMKGVFYNQRELLRAKSKRAKALSGLSNRISKGKAVFGGGDNFR